MSSANPPEPPNEATPRSPSPAEAWPEILTTKEAAAYLRVSPSTLRVSLLAGDIPGMRVGSNWRLLRSELDAIMATRQPTSTIPSRSRDRKGVKLGPRKKNSAETEPQAAEASEAPEPAPE